VVRSLLEIFTQDAVYAQDVVAHVSMEENWLLGLGENDELDDKNVYLQLQRSARKDWEDTIQKLPSEPVC
jgi:hypothetical protein